MFPLIVFGAIVAAPVLLALIMRVNAVFIFLSICAGYLLQMALSDSVDLLVATFLRGSNSLVIARVALFVLPILLTLFLLRKTMGRSLIFQITPLIFSGMMLGVLLLPLLTPGFSQSVYNSQYGGSIRSSSDLITAIAVASNMILAYMLFKGQPKHKKHH
jgi:hypothetical protein